MNKLRNLITAVAATLALSSGVLSATPSSAYVHFGPGGHQPGCCFGPSHGHDHWSFHYGYGDRYGYGWHRWGYHYDGYRPVVVDVSPYVCPLGTHPGYLGKHCWPNH